MIAVVAVLLAGTVAPIGNGNALTLPAARHAPIFMGRAAR